MSIQLLRLPSVLACTGLSRSTVYALMERGEFPRPIKITGKAVAWPQESIARWVAERTQATFP